MSAPQARKDASKVLGVALQAHYRKMLSAVGQEEITAAAVDLGQSFNDNIEFIIWVLKTYGGMYAPAPEPVRRALPVLPTSFTGKPN